ncbi:MAG: HU family DNA-binding protein [Candidatus Caenarcaniphilales bacterium]|nr:HU family DNA-binding protein [Candidatus Caenarcaniphilales bacterium]
MNRAELVAKIAEDTQMTQKQVDSMLAAFIEAVKSTVKAGEKVTLTGFGTFEKRHRKAREGRNPQNGEKIKIPACDVPGFSPGKQFKEAVNG